MGIVNINKTSSYKKGMIKQLLSLLLLLFCSTVIVTGQKPTQIDKQKKLVASVDSILQNQVTNNHIPGAVVEIKTKGHVICRKAWGFAQKYAFNDQLLKQPELMTCDHLFDIASLTKVIGTTTSVMLLADRGLIHIDDAVGKYIPAFNTPDKKEITIRHLLTHTSGLYEWYPLYYRASNKMKHIN